MKEPQANLERVTPGARNPQDTSLRQLASVLVVRLAFAAGHGDTRDPDDALRLGEWRDRMRDLVQHLGGTILERHAHGFAALFATADRFEHHAAHACAAALRVQARLGSYRDRGSAPPLLVRAGVHSGDVICRHGGAATSRKHHPCATGATGETAAALAGLAPEGRVYLSHATYRLLAGQPGLACRSIGEHRVGRELMRVYALEPERDQTAGNRPQTLPPLPFIGHYQELSRLLKRVDQLGRTARGDVLCLTGEPGIGKTRLLFEAAEMRPSPKGPIWVRVRGVSYAGDDLYHCLRDALAQLIGLPVEAGPAGVRAKTPDWASLLDACERLIPEQGNEVASHLALVLGAPHHSVKLSAEKLRSQLPRAAYLVLRAAAEIHPVVLVLDDAQWIDPASASVFEHLMSLVDEAPILLVVSTSDPGHRRVRDLLSARAAQRLGADVITLPPLDNASVGAILDRVVAARPDSGDLIADLADKALGNPLFIAKTVESLIEDGVLESPVAGAPLRVLRAESEVALPDTVQNVILGRLRRLEPRLGGILSVASVIGGRFRLEMLAEVLAQDDDGTPTPRPIPSLSEQLEALSERGLLVRWGHGTDCRYEVSDPFVQETAYRTLSRERRRLLHQRCGQYLETLDAEQRRALASELARHFWAARDWNAAKRYLPKAGDRAYAVAADREAAISYAQAIRSYQRLSGAQMSELQQAVLQRKLGELSLLNVQIHRALIHFDRAATLLGTPMQRGRNPVRRAIAASLLLQLAHRLAPLFFVRTPGASCSEIGQERVRLFDASIWALYWADQERLVLECLRMLNFAERIGNREGQEKGYLALCYLLSNTGNFGPAAHYLRLSQAVLDPDGRAGRCGFAAHLRGLHRLMRGHCAAAEADFREAIQRAEESGEYTIYAPACASLSLRWQTSGNLAAAYRTGCEMIRHGREARQPGLIHWGLTVQGGALMRSERLCEAEESLRSAIDLAWDLPDHECLARGIGELAVCLLRQHRISEAIALLADAAEKPGLAAVRGLHATFLCNARLLLHLVNAGEQDTVAPGAWPAIARDLLQAKREARCYRPALPALLRLEGSLEWLRRRPRRARKCWDRSIALADRQGADLEGALTFLEIANRTGDADAEREGRRRLEGLAFAREIRPVP